MAHLSIVRVGNIIRVGCGTAALDDWQHSVAHQQMIADHLQRLRPFDSYAEVKRILATVVDAIRRRDEFFSKPFRTSAEDSELRAIHQGVNQINDSAQLVLNELARRIDSGEIEAEEPILA